MKKSHPHLHTETTQVLNRMSRIIGHMEAVKGMVEDGRDCTDILIQIAAVRSALNQVGKLILEDHVQHCVVHAVESGDQTALDDLSRALDRFLK